MGAAEPPEWSIHTSNRSRLIDLNLLCFGAFNARFIALFTDMVQHLGKNINADQYFFLNKLVFLPLVGFRASLCVLCPGK